MLIYAVIIALLAIATACTLLRKAYNLVPAHELKRQAANDNDVAKTLYRAVGYGESLRVLLWIVGIASAAVGFVLLAGAASPVLGVAIIAFILWLNILWLPKLKTGSLSLQIAKTLTPAAVWILHYVDAPLRSLSRLAAGHYQHSHSGLYELQDLLDLLDLQSQQPDSRITSEEITLIRNVVGFGDRHVRDVMRPRRQVKTVTLDDAIGPVLLDELHASGQTVFPVKKSLRSKEIVGALQLGDVGIHSTGTVQKYASTGTTYVHESDTLAEALHAFYQTRQQLFIVLDSEQDYVGVLTLEAILQTLVAPPALADLSADAEEDARN